MQGRLLRPTFRYGNYLINIRDRLIQTGLAGVVYQQW